MKNCFSFFKRKKCRLKIKGAEFACDKYFFIKIYFRFMTKSAASQAVFTRLWPLIGHYKSRDQKSGFWLVERVTGWAGRENWKQFRDVKTRIWEVPTKEHPRRQSYRKPMPWILPSYWSNNADHVTWIDEAESEEALVFRTPMNFGQCSMDFWLFTNWKIWTLCPLIGGQKSRDLNTGLWLVNIMESGLGGLVSTICQERSVTSFQSFREFEV